MKNANRCAHCLSNPSPSNPTMKYGEAGICSKCFADICAALGLGSAPGISIGRYRVRPAGFLFIVSGLGIGSLLAALTIQAFGMSPIPSLVQALIFAGILGLWALPKAVLSIVRAVQRGYREGAW